MPSTLTGRSGATPGTATFARPGGDGGNDSALFAEALTMSYGEDDGGGASNGKVELLTSSVCGFKGSATSREKRFVEKGESNGKWVEEEL